MDEIKVPLQVPLDDDGFLRRECPNCEGQFKWFVHQDGDDDSEPVDQYFCPLCGQAAGLDTWWTPEQLAYAQGLAGPAVDEAISDMVSRAFKGTKGLTFKPNRSFTLGTPTPEPLREPNDMVIAEPPCHPHEPVKVAEANTGHIYCLICGAAFAV